MLPTIQPYDVVFLEPISEQDIQVGDVIAVTPDDPFIRSEYIVHRVTLLWERDGSIFMQTQGDNEKRPEHAALAEMAKGKMIGTLPILGIIIGAPGNFVIIGSALFLAIYRRRSEEKKGQSK